MKSIFLVSFFPCKLSVPCSMERTYFLRFIFIFGDVFTDFKKLFRCWRCRRWSGKTLLRRRWKACWSSIPQWPHLPSGLINLTGNRLVSTWSLSFNVTFSIEVFLAQKFQSGWLGSGDYFLLNCFQKHSLLGVVKGKVITSNSSAPP